MTKLSEHEAYAAMYAFLVNWWKLTGSQSHDLAGLLGSMSLLRDGVTADPALWHDWLDAVEKARAGEVDARLVLRKIE